MDIEERMVEPYFEISHVKNLTKVLGIQKRRKRDVGISPKTLFCNVNFWFFSVVFVLILAFFIMYRSPVLH